MIVLLPYAWLETGKHWIYVLAFCNVFNWLSCAIKFVKRSIEAINDF
jgi:hypothetical protein